ncbi:Geranylgeranyl reductase family protein (ChlP, bchP) [Chitinispirillum alkaliphilum]|nr:Geranylgeranyl reductase family protein (ChlP, bchP) [Chitinispirillum alkaliphilum]
MSCTVRPKEVWNGFHHRKFYPGKKKSVHFTTRVSVYKALTKKTVKTVDVAVVGAGLAGAYTGFCLAQKGVDTIVFDNSMYPKNPDYVTLSQSEMYDRFLNKNYYVKKRIPAPEVISPRGKKFPSHGGRDVTMINRVELSRNILEQAMAEGCGVIKEKVLAVRQENGGWILGTKNGILHCRILIGADGVHSIVRKTVLDEHRKENLLFGAGFILGGTTIPKGFLKFLPNGELLKVCECDAGLNAGIFGPLETAYGRRRRLEALLKEQFGSLAVYSPWTSLLPAASFSHYFQKPCSGKNWILTGSAAGHVHPLSGEGAEFALASAELASQAIKCGDPRVFDSLWRDSYGEKLLSAVDFKKHIYSPVISDTLFFAAARSSTLASIISSYISPDSVLDKEAKWKIKDSFRILAELAGAK